MFEIAMKRLQVEGSDPEPLVAFVREYSERIKPLRALVTSSAGDGEG